MSDKHTSVDTKTQRIIVVDSVTGDPQDITDRLDASHYGAIHWIVVRLMKRRLSRLWCQNYPHQADRRLPDWYKPYFERHGKNDVGHKWAIVTFNVPAGSSRCAIE